MAAEWNEEQTAQLARLWNGGGTASEIAPVMKISRNAVIGKINRLRKSTNLITRASMTREQALQASVAAKAAAAIYRQRLEAAGLVRRKGASPETYLGARRQPDGIAKAAPLVFDVSLAKPWLERKFGECAAPVSGEGADTMSCCAKTGGKTYCSGHMSVFFHKPNDTGKRFVNGVARFAA